MWSYSGSARIPPNVPGSPREPKIDNKRRTINQRGVDLASPVSLPKEPGSAEPLRARNTLRLLVDRAQRVVSSNGTQGKPEDRAAQTQCDAHTLRLGQTIHDQEVSVVQPSRRGGSTRRATTYLTEKPKHVPTMSLGEFCGRTRARHRNASGHVIPNRRTGLGSLPLAPPLLHTMETKGQRPCPTNQAPHPRWSY